MSERAAGHRSREVGVAWEGNAANRGEAGLAMPRSLESKQPGLARTLFGWINCRRRANG